MHPVWLYWETELLDACIWLPPDFTPCAFLFADFALHSFSVINPSHEYNYLLNSGLSWQINEYRGGLGDLWHTWQWILFSTQMKWCWCRRGEIGFLRQYFSKLRSSCHIKFPPDLVCLINRCTVFFIYMVHPKEKKKQPTQTHHICNSSFHHFKVRIHCLLIYVVVVSS